jgi:hypothetical protein
MYHVKDSRQPICRQCKKPMSQWRAGDECNMKVPKTFEEKVQQEMNRCIHFNGVQHDKCEAGVNYHELLGDGPGCFAHLPCLKDDSGTVVCPKREFCSRETAETNVNEHEAHIKQFLEDLRQSICQICKVQVKQRQVGSCVYGTCGHRLYQGTVMPEHAAEPIQRPHSRR